MKNINLKTVVLLAFAISLSNLICAQHNHGKMNKNHVPNNKVEHNDNTVVLKDKNLNMAYVHYNMISIALVEANTEEVQKASEILVNKLKKYGNAKEAQELAEKMASNSNLGDQRLLFSELTTEFEPLVKNNIVEGQIYKNFCPMANGIGAYWFSTSEKIMNPYMAKAMVSCGSVKETFKSI